MPTLPMQNNLSLRLTSSQLFADLPNSLRSIGTRAAIYTLAGKRLVEFDNIGANGKVAIPTSGLAHGKYLFEAANRDVKSVQMFSK